MYTRWYASFLALLLLPSTGAAKPQNSGLVLTASDQAQLDAMASRVAQRVAKVKFDTPLPVILVVDFTFRSPDKSSLLGSALADQFSSLLEHHSQVAVLNRQILKDYFQKNWTTIEDIHSTSIALTIARDLGATGIVRANLNEDGDAGLKISLQVNGFGPEWFDQASIPIAKDELALLSRPVAPSFPSSEAIPVEPDVQRLGPEKAEGVIYPSCISCPDPRYSKAASAAGVVDATILLSAVITKEGTIKSIYVLKGFPLGLTQQAINAIQDWKMRPALKDGQPIAVRVEISTRFRLLETNE